MLNCQGLGRKNKHEFLKTDRMWEEDDVDDDDDDDDGDGGDDDDAGTHSAYGRDPHAFDVCKETCTLYKHY